MDPEERFAKTFIKKERRKRVLYELSDPGRRYDGLSRFCHSSGELIDRRKLVMEGSGLERLPEFLAFVKTHNGLCAVMSPDPGVDGLELPLKEAVEAAVMSFDAVIIQGEEFAVVFGESGPGDREKYLLSAEART